MRSEPEAWSARVMTARPPAFSTQAAIASESVATTHRPDLGGLRAPHHMHDHRLAGDIGERLAGQPGRGHAGRDENERVGHRFAGRLAAELQNVAWIASLIRVARGAANRLFVRRRNSGPRRHALPPRPGALTRWIPLN